MKATDGFALVLLDDVPDTTDGGIVLPTKTRDENKVQTGVVIDVGRGAAHWEGERFVYETPLIRTGDRVHFNSWGGEKIEDGEDTIAVLRHQEILAVE
jgi:co-chaperonin GroES (HSP10)